VYPGISSQTSNSVETDTVSYSVTDPIRQTLITNTNVYRSDAMGPAQEIPQNIVAADGIALWTVFDSDSRDPYKAWSATDRAVWCAYDYTTGAWVNANFSVYNQASESLGFSSVAFVTNGGVVAGNATIQTSWDSSIDEEVILSAWDPTLHSFNNASILYSGDNRHWVQSGVFVNRGGVFWWAEQVDQFYQATGLFQFCGAVYDASLHKWVRIARSININRDGPIGGYLFVSDSGTATLSMYNDITHSYQLGYDAPHQQWVYGPGVANSYFIVQPSTGRSPLSVQVNDGSIGTTSVSYDFGDGSPLVSTPASVHTYNAPGLYVIRQTAVTGSGGTVSSSQTVLVASTVGISSFAMNPGQVVGGTGQVASLVISLAAPSPTNGTVVNLSSGDPALLPVPSSVTVPASQSTISVPLSPSAVSAPQTVTISGSVFGGSLQAANLSITPASISSLSFSPPAISVGQSSQMLISLNGPTGASAASIQLVSSNALVNVPGSITVGAGAQSVQVAVTASVAPGFDTNCQITATLNGQSVSQTVQVLAPVPISLTLSPTVVNSGQGSTATVTLNAPAGPNGESLYVLSGNAALAKVSPLVVFAPGTISQTFPIATGAPTQTTLISISAGSAIHKKFATLAVRASNVSAVAVTPLLLYGGLNATGSVQLSAPTGAAMSIALSSTGFAVVPSALTIAANSSYAYFPITTAGVDNAQTFTISASANGILKNYTGLLLPAILQSASLSVQTARPNQALYCTVVLLGKSGSSGTPIQITTDNPSVTVVGSTTIPSGRYYEYVPINTGSFTGVVHISIGYGSKKIVLPLTIS
jgi:hypothetical protein